VPVQQIGFQGHAGKQATVFFYDPSRNAIDIQGFTEMGQLFCQLKQP
jgi:uncharacterized protein